MTYEEMLEQFELWNEELEEALDEYESLKLIEEFHRGWHGDGAEGRLSDDEELWLVDMYDRIEDRVNRAEWEVEGWGDAIKRTPSMYTDEELVEMVEFCEEAAMTELWILGCIEFETEVPWYEWEDEESVEGAWAVAEDEYLLEWLM